MMKIQKTISKRNPRSNGKTKERGFKFFKTEIDY